MSSRICFTFFLLFLSFCVLTKSTHARPHHHHHHHHHPVVEIQNDLPNSTQVPLLLRCDKVSSSYLKLGHHHHQNVTVDRDIECTAMWSPWFTTWDAYKIKRDKGHRHVYWSVKDDGFYHSWDGSKWKLLEYWYTE